MPHEAPLNPALPTVFVVGDSTARDVANRAIATKSRDKIQI
jgi:hypothetical protein